MMSAVAVLDSVAVLGWIVAGVCVVVRWRKSLGRHARPAFLAVCCFSMLQALCMFLEWSGITGALERVEDVIGATLPVWWAFAVYGVVEGMDRRALRRSRERYALAQKAASIGTWDWCLLNDSLRWSDDVEPMLGFDAGEFGRTRQAFLDCVHPKDRPIVDQSMRDAAANGAPLGIEFRIIWPDGTVRWISSAGDLVNGGRVRMLGIMNDITEQKETQDILVRQAETERLLLQELDHRVRNNLSSLVSLIGLSQSGAKSIEGFADAVKSRTHTIALVHSMLSASKWKGSDLQTILRSLIQPLLRTSIVYEGPAVRVPPAQAQAVGLIANELTTNSNKYGAMSRDGGTVRVSWEVVTSDAEACEVSLRWVETGGPPIKDPPRPGVGCRLVEGLARSELAGKAMLSFPLDGADHTIIMRLEDTGTAQFERPAMAEAEYSRA